MESSTYSKWWLPVDISTHGHDIDALMNFIHVFMAVLFAGWGVYFIYCLLKFRAGAGKKAHYAEVSGSISKSIELAVVAIEVVMLVFFSMPVWARVKKEFPKEEDAVHVRIVAQQFQWNFHYPGKDGKFGKARPELVSDDNVLGLDPKDPDGKDDIVAPAGYFRFPADKPVIAELSSKDVIHSFKMPVMRFIHDAMPGQSVRVWFQADGKLVEEANKLNLEVRARLEKKLADATAAGDQAAIEKAARELQVSLKPGQFEVICAQLCGIGHTTMRATFEVMKQADFDAWLAAEDAKKKNQ